MVFPIKLLSLQKNLLECVFIFSAKDSGFIFKLVKENLPSHDVWFNDLLNLKLVLKKEILNPTLNLINYQMKHFAKENFLLII